MNRSLRPCVIAYVTVLLVYGLAPLRVIAEDPTTQPADVQAIERAAADFARAFNAGDADGIAAHWTADAQCVDESGVAVHGRETIREVYARLFALHPGVRMEVSIDSVRLISPTTAIEEGRATTWTTSGARASAQYIAVHIKQDGTWLVASSREWPDPSAPAGPNPDLLMGQWGTTAGQHSLHTTFEAVLEGHFIKRTFEVRNADGLMISGFEIILFDGATGRANSWMFDSQGGLSQGTWMPDGERWIIEARGVHADGQQSTAMNILTIADKDHLTWHSVRRTLDGEAMPDIDEINIGRLGDQN